MALVDWLGAVGVSLLLLAFVLNARGVLASDARAYHGMNVVGAALSCTASVLLDYVPFVVLEGTWAVVAAVALVRGPRARPTEPS